MPIGALRNGMGRAKRKDIIFIDREQKKKRKEKYRRLKKQRGKEKV